MRLTKHELKQNSRQTCLLQLDGNNGAGSRMAGKARRLRCEVYASGSYARRPKPGFAFQARCGTNIQPSMMRRAVRCVVTLTTSQSAPRRCTCAPTSIMPAGCPRRSRSVVAARDTSCTTVPSTAAATAVHIEDVAGKVRCVFSIEMARATRSMCSTVMFLPLLLWYAAGGATMAIFGIALTLSCAASIVGARPSSTAA